MTFIEKFNSIQKKFAKADTEKLSENFAVQVNLTDEDCGGTFYIAYIGDSFAIEPYDYVDHTAMVTAPAKTFEDFLAGKKDIEALDVEGNVSHILQIASTLEKKKVTPKKTPVKKAPAKKATAKKTVVKSAEKKADKKVKAEQMEMPITKSVEKATIKPEKKASVAKPTLKK